MLPVLQADCSQCFALCCVLLPFGKASGFGMDKSGGTPCPNLDGADSCSIHATLADDGWRGCTIFDCAGAGQRVSQQTYAGTSWRDAAANRGEMAAVLSVMRLLHESLWHLSEVADRLDTAAADELTDHINAIAGGTPDDLLSLDIDETLADVSGVLTEASALIRGGAGADLSRQDLAGKDLRGRDLRAASLRGAVLIAADLRDQNLSDADLLGTDTRDADVRGADLSRALFLTQAQANALVTDDSTRLPSRIVG